MLHRCLWQLGKAKSSAPRRHVLRRPLRRSVSSGSGAAAAARRSSTGRTPALNGAHFKASRSLSPPSAGTSRGGRGVSGRRNGSCPTTDVTSGVTDTDGSGSTAVTLASGDGLGSAPAEPIAATSASVRRPLYRLATAVATVIVPPTTNVYLQGMKHLLTPATSSTSVALSRAGPATPSVSVVEEYYTAKKGPLFATAVVAGTNAVKQVSSLVPFCYPTPIQRCSFTFRRRQVLQPPRPAQMPHRVVLRRRTSEPSLQHARSEYSVLYCFCTVATESKGGVEMEALTGATMASVTLYDMLKGLPGAQEDGLSLGESFVLAKRGGRNDFTKLLISEPDRPSVESSLHSGETEMHALPSSSSATGRGGGAGESFADLSGASQSALTGSGVTATARQDVDGHVSADEGQTQVECEDRPEKETEKEDQGLAAKRVVRRAAPAATVDDDVLGEPATPDDGDAWWRTSKQEKRLQELYPRRKYGDNARLVSTNLTPAAVGSPPTKAHKRAAPSETSDRGEGVATARAAVVAARPKLATRASAIRDVRASTADKGNASATAIPRATSRAVSPGSSAEGGTVGGEDDDTVEHRRSLNRSRLAKKSARAVTPTVEAADDDDDEGEAAAAVDAEADEETVSMTPAAVDEAEEGELAVTASPKKRRRGSTPTTSTSKGHSPILEAKPSFYGKRPLAGHRRYPAELEEEEEAQDASEDEAVVAEEDGTAEDIDEETEEEGEERVPLKSSAAVAARRMHAHNSMTERRTGKSAIVPLSRNTGANSRKQRAGRVAPKKGRASAQADDDDDTPVAYDSNVENANGVAGDDDDDDDDVTPLPVAKLRGKPVAKQSRPAPPKKGGAMRPVRHDSWDAGSSQRRRDVHGHRGVARWDEDTVEEAAEAVHEDGDEEDVEDVEDVAPPPLPPPRKQLKKPLKRAALKRR
ncbi:hypothetical protein JKF63_03692 [Porcisia hertigi]|uniref:Molybdopterin cofactor biosynthesis C (MoaC) domain-containing protein n=1 Tax=Porcisia hertigi TaxID=2761500 RepID=A0A836I8V8_9TRYP|nr:hypothetical protein JKF63_03692 [Porcisia hertigi]